MIVDNVKISVQNQHSRVGRKLQKMPLNAQFKENYALAGF